ncbi:MAG: rRNA pseudouridine synthase, partial [Actinomycetia bacterium]|nr:rRNA pseudouridine synthase [Actinomycetes bacterium]
MSGPLPGVRLHKLLASAGVGSRRACEQLMVAGRVSVDGVVVTAMGARVDPASAVVRVDGARVVVRDDLVYLALNKPRGVLSAMSDDRGRRTVADLLAEAGPRVEAELWAEAGPRADAGLPAVAGLRAQAAAPAAAGSVGASSEPPRLFHVGRLDADTEGLLLVTNDGALAHRLTHPSFGVVKTYLARVAGPVGRDVGRRLRAGVELDDGPARVDAFWVVQQDGTRALVEVSLHEGRNRIVRRMLAEVGHPVLALVRTAFGPIRLGG